MLCSDELLPQFPHLRKVKGCAGSRVLLPLESMCTRCSWVAPSDGHPQAPEWWGWLNAPGQGRAARSIPASPFASPSSTMLAWQRGLWVNWVGLSSA